MSAIAADIGNVHTACLWAAARAHVHRLDQAVQTLGLFHYNRARETHEFMGLLYTVAGHALLAAHEGGAERAIELHALTRRCPLVANSKWFEDVIGQQIAAAGATLPADVVQAAKERGQDRDLARTAVALDGL